jgi:UDP-N-acetylglucosamine transferase subunit ALG13
LIFVTVGTHYQPFDRLLDGLAALAGEELVVQYGTGEAPTAAARAEAFMPFDEMVDCFREAEKVITHAGVGSIICARREGHVPLVVPRRADLGEHVDEHQVELTEALTRRESVIGVLDTQDLPTALSEAPSRGAPNSRLADDDLVNSIRQALLTTVD